MNEGLLSPFLGGAPPTWATGRDSTGELRNVEMAELVAALRALYEVYDRWWHRVGTVEPPEELVAAGYASLISIEDDQAMDDACEAVELHLSVIRRHLPDLFGPSDDRPTRCGPHCFSPADPCLDPCPTGEVSP